MSLQKYIQEWIKDSILDKSKIDTESLKVPLLHAKYLQFLSNERLQLKNLDQDKKKLEQNLEDYYTGKIDGKSINREPYQIVETKTSAQKRIESDPQIIKFNKDYIEKEEIVLFLKEVIISLNQRGFAIKNHIDYMRFIKGVD
jgi:hypothetical protein